MIRSGADTAFQNRPANETLLHPAAPPLTTYNGTLVSNLAQFMASRLL